MQQSHSLRANACAVSVRRSPGVAWRSGPGGGSYYPSTFTSGSALRPDGCAPSQTSCPSCGGAYSSGTVGGGEVFYYHTGACSQGPYLNRAIFRSTAAEGAAPFRVYATNINNVNVGTTFYPAGSSVLLTGASVETYAAQFMPGTSTSMIPPTGTSGSDLYVVLWCDAPAGQSCAFNYFIDAGCLASRNTATVTSRPLDACRNFCTASGHGGCDAATGACACTDGYTGSTCSTPPSSTPADGTAGAGSASASTCPSGQTCTQGQCFTAGGLVTRTTCQCICSNGGMQAISGATSCADCTTRCAATSCTSGTSCSASSTYQNPTATGATCDTGAAVAPSSSSTGASAAAGVYDSSVWLGTYSAWGCSTSKCCCAGSVSITEATDGSTNYVITAGSFTGQCPSGTPSALGVITERPTSATHTYTLDGQTHTATSLAPSGSTIFDRNHADSACSANLDKTDGAVSGAALSCVSTCWQLVGAVVFGILAVAAH